MQPTSPVFSHSLEFLKHTPVFKGLNNAQLGDMLLSFRQETWKGQTPITTNPLEQFFIVTRGQVELVRTNYSSGRELTLFILHPGDVFNVMTLMDSQISDITPIPINEVTLLSVSVTRMRAWLNIYPWLYKNLLLKLAQQARTLEELAVSLTFHDTSFRLEQLLNQQILPGKQPLVKCNHSLPIMHKLSHETLARMIGSVRVVVSRHIQEMKKNGLLISGRKNLTILDHHTAEENRNAMEKSQHHLHSTYH